MDYGEVNHDNLKKTSTYNSMTSKGDFRKNCYGIVPWEGLFRCLVHRNGLDWPKRYPFSSLVNLRQLFLSFVCKLVHYYVQSHPNMEIVGSG